MTMPRLMKQSEAAAYCGLSPSQFTTWVKAGRISPSIPGTHRWDRVALDQDIDKLSGIKTKPVEVDPLEEWKKKRDARRAQRPVQDQQNA